MTEDQLAAATFLLVDDDAISVMAMRRALKKLKITNRTRVAKDGQDALDILREVADATNGQLPPFIVMLDLNMPRMSGREFLEVVRSEPQLHGLVVFVFTTAPMPADSQSADCPHVAGYLTKDNPLETFAAALDSLRDLARAAELPA